MLLPKIAIVSDTPYFADARLQRTVEAALNLPARVTVIERGVDPDRSRELLDLRAELESSFIPTAWLGRKIWHLSNRLTPLVAHRARTQWLEETIAAAEPALIHCINPFALEAARTVAERLGVPLIYEPYEYWPSHLYSETYHLPLSLTTHLAEVERQAVPKVAAMVAVSPTMADEYAELLGAPAATVTYNSGPTTPEMPPVTPPSLPVRLVHSGSAPANRNVSTVVRALASVDAVTLDILGAGDQARALAAAAEELDLGCRVTARDRVAFDQVVQELAQYDVGLIAHSPDTAHLDLTLPNKLFDYMAAGLAIVAVRTRALAEFPGIEDFAVLIDGATPQAFASAVRQLVIDPERTFAMKRASRAAYAHYSREQQVRTTTALYGRILGLG